VPTWGPTYLFVLIVSRVHAAYIYIVLGRNFISVVKLIIGIGLTNTLYLSIQINKYVSLIIRFKLPLVS
jgi:hypothetical protein